MSSRHTKTIYLGGRTLVVQAAMMQGNDTFNIWSQCMSLTFFILFKRHDSKSETDRKSSYPLVQSPNTSMALTKAKQTWGARSLNPGVPHWWGGTCSLPQCTAAGSQKHKCKQDLKPGTQTWGFGSPSKILTAVPTVSLLYSYGQCPDLSFPHWLEQCSTLPANILGGIAPSSPFCHSNHKCFLKLQSGAGN